MVGTLSLGSDALIFCPPSILLPISCVAADDDDIIYADRTTNEITALRGNDIAFANVADTRVFGGKDDDLLTAGSGNYLVDCGPNDDVVLAGAGSDLLVEGKGNDKLFNGVPQLCTAEKVLITLTVQFQLLVLPEVW